MMKANVQFFGVLQNKVLGMHFAPFYAMATNQWDSMSWRRKMPSLSVALKTKKGCDPIATNVVLE